MKKLIVLTVIALAAAAGGGYLYLSNIRLRASLEQSRAEGNKYQEEIIRIQSDRDRSESDKEKLQQDSVAYLSLNSKLQEENRKLLASLEETRTNLQKKEQELEKQRGALQEMTDKLRAIPAGDPARTFQQLDEMKGKIAEMEKLSAKERQLYHYNLGVAYTKARMYDEAVDSYETAITFGDTNPEAHYNLGIIYEKIKHLPLKALLHYQRFLELAPESQDAREVADWVKRLSPVNLGKGAGNG